MTESLQIVSIVERTKNLLLVKIEVENISKAANSHFCSYFKGVHGLNIRPFYPAPPFSSSFNQTNAIQTLNNVIDTARIFSDIQKMYIKALSRDIASLDNYVDGFAMVTAFRNQITHSKELELRNDKILLLEFASGTNALLEFMENDGALAVQRSLQEMLGNSVPIGRLMECSVDWRDVWVGAVFGLATGAIIWSLFRCYRRYSDSSNSWHSRGRGWRCSIFWSNRFCLRNNWWYCYQFIHFMYPGNG